MTNTALGKAPCYISIKIKYSRTSIIRTPMCHLNLKGVQIREFVRVGELSDKHTI